MLVRRFSKVFMAAAMFFAAVSSFAQTGAYTDFTPYSIFAVGDLTNQGSAYNRSMGGVGIASRNNRYLNYLNPAATTARDSLSFMADMSLQMNNKIYSQGDIHNGQNTFNLQDLAISFPVYKSSAAMIGITPYSTTGYGYGETYDDADILARTGGYGYSSNGQGNIYQFFVAAGVTFWKKLSIGVQGIQYFGDIERTNTMMFAQSDLYTINSGSRLILRGTTAKFGLQYEQLIGTRSKVTIGATYKLGAKMSGFSSDYEMSVGAYTDTLRYVVDTLKTTRGVSFPSEVGLGISLNVADRWRAEVDYTFSDWTNSGVTDATGFAVKGRSVFTATKSQALRAGFEIVPNRNDIRYFYRRCAYRVGAYYDKAYYLLDGNEVNSYGITLGGTIPVFRYYNGITFGMDIGQRASLAGNMIRERYVNFSIGFNIFDYWFQKSRYK